MLTYFRQFSICAALIGQTTATYRLIGHYTGQYSPVCMGASLSFYQEKLILERGQKPIDKGF